ncbi:hypothetical protein [Pseudoduganella sp. R-43]|uniref:hypothetical protein n=1 Tax=Pseudoduganella sp. R-43 TaxID=3404063 RepID=UPI003CF2D331
MATKIAFALMAAAALSGCKTPYSSAPLATNFPTTRQEKLQAAAHWNAIAGHLQQQLIAELKKAPPRPLYVASPVNQTPFQQAINNQLISSLVRDGYVVSRTPAGALQIDLDIQAITFSPNRKQAPTVGVATAIATGVWVVAERIGDPVGKLGRFAGAAGVGAGIDAYQWYGSEFASGPTPRTEIIITASVTDEHRYLARAANTYYVADTDRALYGIRDEAVLQISQSFQVKGDR